MMDELEVEEPRSRGSSEFAESALLGTLIPLESNLNIEEALKVSVDDLDSTADSPLSGILQRQALFFGQLRQHPQIPCPYLTHS